MEIEEAQQINKSNLELVQKNLDAMPDVKFIGYSYNYTSVVARRKGKTFIIPVILDIDGLVKATSTVEIAIYDFEKADGDE